MNSPPDHSLRGPRPGLTLVLLLAAAAMMLAGGVWLARRTVERRIPADRALLRESAAALQAELSRLDQLFLGHLQRLAGEVARSEPPAVVRPAAERIEGIRLFSVMTTKGTRGVPVKLAGPGTPPPEPEFTLGGKRPTSQFAFPIPREPIFGADEKTPLAVTSEGWIGKPGDAWIAWWQRLEAERAVVFIIRGSDVRVAIDRHLAALLPAVWAPVRAAGGMDRVEGPEAKHLAGLAESPDHSPDFIVPLASRLGYWQIVSWDRWETRTVFDFLTLVVAGTFAVGLALLGWVVAAAQRRALREVTARVSFVNRVSHELGAPLTNLGLYLDLARDSLAAGDSAESARRLAIATEETGRLSRLVANVLTFARGERRSLEVHPADCRPGQIVRGVIEQFSPALARRNVAVESDLDDTATAHLDPGALAQITANLISNVEKYAASGGWMRVSLATAAGELVLRIADRGPGIPASEAARVFLPFERLDSRLTEGVSGTGLGLAIARDLAGRMGGDVELETGETGGCSFTLRVPAAASAPAEVSGIHPLPQPAPAS